MGSQDLSNRVELHFSKEGLTEEQIDAKVGKHVRFFGKNFKRMVEVEIIETSTMIHMVLTEVKE